MAINTEQPVWITGVVLKATRQNVSIHTYDKNGRPKDVTLARIHILQERDTRNGGGFDFQIPQRVAYQGKLAYRKN